MERIIIHVDVNNAFLSWTAVWMLKKGYNKDIRERYLSLTHDHIEHVLKNLPEDDSNVGLKDKYLMAYLFNAPDTIDAICRTQQMHSKHNMCTREYDWEEMERSLIQNGSW